MAGIVTVLCLMFMVAVANSATAPEPGADPAATDDQTLFYFYSPDWRPGNLGLLTQNFEEISKEAGLNVLFQAFARYQDFTRQLKKKTPSFLLAPAWIESQAGSFSFTFHAILRPHLHGKTSYRKGLVVKNGINPLTSSGNISIAATVHVMGPSGQHAILDAFDLDPARAKVVPVQKDIDALLALTFDQVDAALVTSAQFEAHAKTNPAIVTDFQIIALSPDIYLPPVYATPDTDATTQRKIVKLLSGLNETEHGRRLLDLLGYDGLVPDRTVAPRQLR